MTKKLKHTTRVSIYVIIAIFTMTAVFAMNTDTVSAATKKPTKVKTVTVTQGVQTSLIVKWSKAKRAKKYQIAYKKVGGTYKITSRYGRTVELYTASGTKYYIKVRAINGKKKGKWSTTVAKTTKTKTWVPPVYEDQTKVVTTPAYDGYDSYVYKEVVCFNILIDKVRDSNFKQIADKVYVESINMNVPAYFNSSTEKVNWQTANNVRIATLGASGTYSMFVGVGELKHHDAETKTVTEKVKIKDGYYIYK